MSQHKAGYGWYTEKENIGLSSRISQPDGGYHEKTLCTKSQEFWADATLICRLRNWTQSTCQSGWSSLGQIHISQALKRLLYKPKSQFINLQWERRTRQSGHLCHPNTFSPSRKLNRKTNGNENTAWVYNRTGDSRGMVLTSKGVTVS